MRISVELPIEQGELVAKALERAAGKGDSALGVEFTATGAGGVSESAAAQSAANGWSAQQADALVTIAQDYLRGDSRSARPSSAADHYQIVVHADGSALHGGTGRCDLPIETVKRLACDGSLITLVEDEEGAPLDVGRKKRTNHDDASPRTVGARQALHVSGLPQSLLRRWPPHRALGGAIYFQRPDGRVIPRFGYRLDDMRDDDATEENPSMEVREPKAPYGASSASSRSRSTGFVR